MKNTYYIYLHIKETDGYPFYVGKGIKRRFEYKTQRSKWWNNIVEKYGFDIIFLETNLTEEEALEKEIYWIKRIGRKDLNKGPLINLTNGGDGISGHTHTLETRLKISVNRKAVGGKSPTKETRLKISLSSIGNKKNNKSVTDTITGIIYPSIKDAAIAFNLKPTTLRDYLGGRAKNKTTLIKT